MALDQRAWETDLIGERHQKVTAVNAKLLFVLSRENWAILKGQNQSQE
jgi:hypothetical protein